MNSENDADIPNPFELRRAEAIRRIAGELDVEAADVESALLAGRGSLTPDCLRLYEVEIYPDIAAERQRHVDHCEQCSLVARAVMDKAGEIAAAQMVELATDREVPIAHQDGTWTISYSSSAAAIPIIPTSGLGYDGASGDHGPLEEDDAATLVSRMKNVNIEACITSAREFLAEHPAPSNIAGLGIGIGLGVLLSRLRDRI